MDLPENTPAGGFIAPVFQGDRAVAAKDVTESGQLDQAQRLVAPANALRAFGLGRIAADLKCLIGALPNVLKAGVAFQTSTLVGSGGKIRPTIKTSPDAQGQKMKTRTAQLAGIGLAVLVLNSCGQKPAPAETLDSARPAAQANKGPVQAMRVVRVEQRNMTDEIVASGRLVVREEAAVGAELPGYLVKKVYVDEGDWVKQGQPLAQLDDTLLQAQIAQAEASLATQKATVDFKQAQLDRGEALANEGALPKEQLDQRRMEATSAKASLLASQAAVNEMKVRQSRMTLRAPVAGMILQRTLRPGEISAAVSTSGPYFRIARDGLIELDAELPDQKLAQLKEGDKADIYLPTGKQISGKVRFISPRVDQNTNLGRARIELPFDKELRPGSFAEAHLKGSASGALTVLAGAIRYEAGGPALMVVDNSNIVHRTPVKLGAHTGDYVQLLEGPPSGSRVLAVGAAFTLDGDVIQPVEGEVAAAAPPATPGSK